MNDESLPIGWTTTTFAEVVMSFSNGIGGTQNKEGIGIPVSRIETIAEQRINFERVGYLAEHDPAKIGKYKLNYGDILFSHINSPAHLGKTAIFKNDRDLYHGINLLRIVVNRDVVHPRFFDYRCKLARIQGEFALRAQHAVNQSSINQKKLGEFKISLAPLAEQKRIADKLDTLLARVDACRERLNRVPLILKRFRQSVLAAATTGQLTIDWRENHAHSVSADTLLLRLKEAHDVAGGHARGNASAPTDDVHDLTVDILPAGWQVAELKDICTPGRPITYGILKPGPELEEGIPYIRVADFPGNKLNLSGIKKTSPEIDQQYKRSRLQAGDLLLSIRGSVGRLIKIPKELENANITQDTARLSISRLVSADYIYYTLLSESVQRRMKNATRGVAVRGINIGDVRALQVPLPSVAEQGEIVRRVEALFAIADRLEARLSTTRTSTDRLTPALLANAFRGELVPQDPNDEPATELLKQLASARESTTKTKRSSKSVTPA
jgi:type I restriction enzyme S subunit